MRRLFVFGCLLLLSLRASGAPATEKGAFTSAELAFQDGFYARAEAEFNAFVQQFTNSTRIAEAVLLQAQARIELTNYAGAVALLTTHLPRAGSWAHEYLFWSGEGLLRMGDLPKAAEQFAGMLKQYPGSSRALDAAVGEATARSRLGEWQRVTELLWQTNGVFQSIARTNAGSESLARGYLLLGDAQFMLQDYAGAEAALQPLARFQLSPRLAWQRQHLQCRLLVAQGHADQALQCATNLLALATNAAQRVFLAESIGFYAGLLKRLGRTEEALGAYEKNLAEGFPAERQREALSNIAELAGAGGLLPRAAQVLESYCAQPRPAGLRDLGLLLLGELRLRQYRPDLPAPGVGATQPAAATAQPGTNYLEQSLAALNTLVKEFPQSAFLGKAQLDLGWCFWLQDKMPEAQAAFQAAVERLAPSPEQATAYFKLADCRFRLKDYAGATTNYLMVAEKFGDQPEVRTNLLESALYQVVRAAVEAGDLSAATNGLSRILAAFPVGRQTERAVLLAGQEISRRGDSARARQIFTDFVTGATNSALLPEIELAIARTFEQESRWDDALSLYDRWLARFTNSSAIPRAEYCRAWANFQAGRETNAFTLFTNFVAHYPANESTPMAQWWIADYYFATGRIVDAEEKFQLLYLSTNWPRSELSYQALLMAGRAAVARQGWKDAVSYFTNLTGDIKCPSNVWLQAMFAYGDTLMSRDSTNKLGDYEDAVSIFTRLCDAYPTNQMAVLATGQKASCLLQWAQFTGQYGPATNEFLKVIQSPLANPTARAIARVGMAVVLEKQAEQKPAVERAALVKAALNEYLDVLYFEKDLREGERPDLFWVRKAGLEAARITEATPDWTQAINIYQRLRQILPALGPSFDKKILKAEESRARAG